MFLNRGLLLLWCCPMSMHLQRQIDRLKRSLLSLAGMAEEAVESATRAIETRNVELAQRVIKDDRQIDQMEIEVEEECLHTLALHQPVAFDLRFVVSVLKINSDLERIGDLAVNIAEQAQFLADLTPLDPVPFDLPRMWAQVRSMLKDSLDALVNIDVKLAQEVCHRDDGVDDLHRRVYVEVEAALSTDRSNVPQLVHLLSVSRNLERIGDHAVNIAEDVQYMALGDFTRHARRRT